MEEFKFLPKPTVHNFIDLTGKTFHYLTALGIVERIDRIRVNVWLCRCKCGNLTRVRAQELRTLGTKSCGCWDSEVTARRNRTHGMSKTPEHGIWESMRKRCTNPRSKDYLSYGGRGITVCKEWNDFAQFYRDMGPRPSSRHSIERLDNDKGYSPDNCIWASPMRQANNKRTSRLLTHAGRTQTLAQWSRETGMHYTRILARLKRGWSVAKALTEPRHTNKYA
jgi:hypothetical protein